MGFRFRRRIKIAPGIRLNLSKSGISTSIGDNGLTWNSRGTVTTGLPGTGLSYRHNLNNTDAQPSGNSTEVRKAYGWFVNILGFVLTIIGFFANPGILFVGMCVWAIGLLIRR